MMESMLSFLLDREERPPRPIWLRLVAAIFLAVALVLLATNLVP
jgi:hypothetical protein